MKLIAKWYNGLGEECEEVVRAEFREAGVHYVVVYEWRSQTYVVRKATDCEFELDKGEP